MQLLALKVFTLIKKLQIMTTLTYNEQFHQDCTHRFFQLPEVLMDLLGDRCTKVFWKLHQWIQHSGKNYHEVRNRTDNPDNWIPEELRDEADYDTLLNTRWIYNNYEGWAKLFKVKVGTVRGAFKLLRTLGLIHVAQFGKSGVNGCFDRRLWVAINYKKATEFVSGSEALISPDVQNFSSCSDINCASSYISKENSSKNTHNINREDAAECVSEFKSLENNPEVLPFLSKVEMAEQPQDFELPTDNSFSVGQIKQELSDKQTIPHEDQIIPPPHDATQQDTPQIVEKPIIDTEIKAKRELIEGRGMVWNPKLKGMLAHYSLEQVVKAIAHMSIVHKIRNYRFTNCEGYLIDALKYEYLETTHEYLELDDEQRERLLWMVQAIAYGIAYESIILNVAATDFESPLGNWWPVEVCMKWSKKYGWRSLREEIIRQNTPPTA